MKSRSFLDKALLLEEKRSTLLFYGLVYAVGLIYHLYYYYFLSYHVLKNFILVKFLLLSAPYVILLILLPVALVLVRTSFLPQIKYAFTTIFVLTSLIAELLTLTISNYYDSGNISEVVMVIFSAIFVNQTFFWFVSGILFVKYLIIVLAYPQYFDLIVIPVMLSGVICILGYIILRRFLAYVKSINIVYNEHFSSMVKGIIAMLELKDPHTKGHSERVAKYSVALARKLGRFTEQELDTLYYSCLIHDIGKLQVSDDILTKPDRLTDDEFEVVKMHTIFGVNAIKDIESLQPCIDIVRSHHERWDGTGYPDGLKGEEIPLLTRIASIADAFDAMTSHRAYRAALTPDEAYARIIKGAGTQFDPGLIPYFKNVFPTWLSILNDYHDTHEEEYYRLYGA
jgi:putative nucleotidyltransferase with HDIG domain